jgi:hypothetical protein
MFHGRLDCFQKLLLGGRPDTKPGDHGTLHVHNRWLILFYFLSCVKARMNRNSFEIAIGRGPDHICLHTTLEGTVTTLHDFGDVLGRPFWTLSFGRSQFHGHCSWLLCEVLLIPSPHMLVANTNERFLPASDTFRVILASESHWLQPLLVLFVRWWPTPAGVGRV